MVVRVLHHPQSVYHELVNVASSHWLSFYLGIFLGWYSDRLRAVQGFQGACRSSKSCQELGDSRDNQPGGDRRRRLSHGRQSFQGRMVRAAERARRFR